MNDPKNVKKLAPKLPKHCKVCQKWRGRPDPKAGSSWRQGGPSPSKGFPPFEGPRPDLGPGGPGPRPKADLWALDWEAWGTRP